jgi:O-methyltransferase
MSKLLNRLYNVFSLSYCIVFIVNGAGKEYGIGPVKKLFLAVKILRNYRKYNPLSTWQQHLLLFEEILSIPRSVKGDVVECGCFDGSTTIPLSIACGLTNRRLFVCDSFEGIPVPKDDEKFTIHGASVDYYIWEKGEFSSHGGLEAVKRNVEKSGNIEACVFVKGFFSDTLKNLDTDSITLVFEDADLMSSVEDCIRYLWPRLQMDCKFYCHEPWSIEVVSLFYDKDWWNQHLNTSPPGFFGSGRGVMVGFRYYPGIGYIKKFNPAKIKQEGKKIVHAGSKGF